MPVEALVTAKEVERRLGPHSEAEERGLAYANSIALTLQLCLGSLVRIEKILSEKTQVKSQEGQKPPERGGNPE